ncbi:hypothetical protein MMC34_000691 [Xylographa carneopallida]|nr:hypothetical protein [Xylographa carneopallida]
MASGAYHDLVIHCRPRSWKVHRVVLCVQSEFFRNVCDGPFEVQATPLPTPPAPGFHPSRKADAGGPKEPGNREITLADTEPDILVRRRRRRRPSPGASHPSPEPPGHPRPRVRPREPLRPATATPCDRYALRPLQLRAAQKTAAALARAWTEDGTAAGFVHALDLAWTTTPRADRGLRACYLVYINAHTAELRSCAPFFELLHANVELMVNVVEGAWDAMAGMRRVEGAGRCEGDARGAGETGGGGG